MSAAAVWRADTWTRPWKILICRHPPRKCSRRRGEGNALREVPIIENLRLGRGNATRDGAIAVHRVQGAILVPLR